MRRWYILPAFTLAYLGQALIEAALR